MNNSSCWFHLTILIACYFFCSSAQQNEKKQLFPMVEIPDSVRLIVGEFLKQQEHLDTTFAAFYIYNYTNPKDYEFKDGIYTFRLMGPHFQPRIMIHNKGKIDLFQNTHIAGLLEEFLVFIKTAEINDKEKIKYLKMICRFLEDGYKKAGEGEY